MQMTFNTWRFNSCCHLIYTHAFKWELLSIIDYVNCFFYLFVPDYRFNSSVRVMNKQLINCFERNLWLIDRLNLIQNTLIIRLLDLRHLLLIQLLLKLLLLHFTLSGFLLFNLWLCNLFLHFASTS
jgi:hypothetical protein